MKNANSFVICLLLILLWSCNDLGTSTNSIINNYDDCGIENGDNSTCVNYSTEIQPIFDSDCVSCHGNGGGLDLTSYQNLMNGGNSGLSIEPGNATNSYLINKLRGTASGDQMPIGYPPLSESIIQLIETWINEGALDN